MTSSFSADSNLPSKALDLESARLLRIGDVSHAVGLCQSQIYQLIAMGRFPAPIKLSPRCSRWRAATVLAWLAGVQ